MMKIIPYLGFNGKCREAMNFYKECFGGELSIQTNGESPMAEQFPENMRDNVLHSFLDAGGVSIMGSDMVSPEGHKPGNDVSLSINFDSEEKIREVFAKLSDGGNIIEELQESFWGSLFGVVRDKFGKTWMLDCELDKNK